MSTDAASSFEPFSRFEQLRFVQQVLRIEGQALLDLAKRVPSDFCDAVDLLYRCRGSVIVSGMGKAGLVGRKIMASLASTGTSSHFLHPAEAIHGDLGRIHRDDVALILSFSGETEEVVRLLPSLSDLQTPIVALTRSAASTLGAAADVVLELGPLEEAGHLGLAPSTSTTAMLAFGDALALLLSRMRGFRPQDFAQFHPGGSLGRRLAKVEEVMRPVEHCRVAKDRLPVRQILIEQSRPGRRSGAIVLTDDQGRLSGIFTDSDLSRLLAEQRYEMLNEPISASMTRSPKSIAAGERLEQAVALLERFKISELPVVDDRRQLLGLIDITDVVGWPLVVTQPAQPPRIVPMANPHEGLHVDEN